MHGESIKNPSPHLQHTLKMGAELVSETYENLHVLSRLPARENFIEFCRLEKLQDL